MAASHPVTAGLGRGGGPAEAPIRRARARADEGWASVEDRMRLVAALLGLGVLLVWILFLQG